MQKDYDSKIPKCLISGLNTEKKRKTIHKIGNVSQKKMSRKQRGLVINKIVMADHTKLFHTKDMYLMYVTNRYLCTRSKIVSKTSKQNCTYQGWA